MNRLVSRTIFSTLKKSSVRYVPMKNHSTEVITDRSMGGSERLRAVEETYCSQYSTPIAQPALEAVHKYTEANMDNPHMMVSQVQARLFHQLVKLLKPSRVLEIGGFTGYSAIAMGSALAPGASLVSLELDAKHCSIIRDHIKQANLQKQVSVIEGPAGESLSDIGKTSPGQQFDLIFLDADKGGYIDYYELIFKHNLLSDRGLLVVDNVLFYGQVHKQDKDYKGNETKDDTNVSKNLTKQAKKVHAFNQHVYNDPKVEVVILPVFDGLSFIQKKL